MSSPSPRGASIVRSFHMEAERSASGEAAAVTHIRGRHTLVETESVAVCDNAKQSQLAAQELRPL